MTHVRHFFFCFRMLLALALFIMFLPPKMLSQVSTQPKVENEESGEEILARENFYHMKRAGGPGLSIPKGAYEAAHHQLMKIPKDRDTRFSVTSATSWVNINPSGMFYNRTGATYISGRTNSFAFHPTDPATFYIGAAGGGVWKTTDGGAHFQPTTDNLGALTSGAVTVDPNNPNIVYVATGELNYSLDSYFGDGIFKSSDGGTTWTQIASSALGNYFSTVIVDPQNSNIVYAAGSNGVYKSTNGGGRWTSTNSGTYVNSLVMDPSNHLVLYAASQGSFIAPVLKTTDGGATWNPSVFGLPSSNVGRITLAISNSSPNVLYASIADGTSGSLLGLYQTLDSGEVWALQNSSVNYLGSQGWYDNSIAVNPTDPNSIVVGGLDVYTSIDGGVTLTQRSVWYTLTSANMTHADIHYLGYNGGTMYCGSDGGVYQSTDNGLTWSDMNQTISTLQFQSADYDPTNTQRVYGGTQDNDKEYTTNGGAQWIQRTTGDGGYTIVDPVNTNYIYGQYVEGSLERSSNSGLGYTEISPSAATGGLFYNPYEMAPGDHNTIVFGCSDVWITSDVQNATTGSGWTKIASTSVVGGGSVSGIGISSTTTNKIYLGTNIGKILVTTDGGVSWSSSSGYPYVSDFAVDPLNDSICYATCTGFSASQHVFKTTNSGTTWVNIGSSLPNIPVNTVVLREAAPRTLFVGTDLGVFKSSDEGTTWVSFNSGLPAVEIYDLKYKESSALLLAATHGRGCYTFDLSALSAQRTLAINSSNPSAGVSINVSPNDINGHGNDISPFNRLFYDITGVSVTAPAMQGGNYFAKWIEDSTILTLNQTINVLMDTNHAVTALYSPLQTVVLALTSSNPSGGISVNVSPSDNILEGNGVTPLLRYFFETTPVHLSVPEISGSNHFIKWQLDGIDYSDSASMTIVLDGGHTLNAVYGPTTVPIAPEWNLVSVSTQVPVWLKSVLYPTAISGAFAYNGSYTQVDTLAGGAGYWVRFPSSLTDTMNGTPILSDTIGVTDGWNLIGSISLPVPLANIVVSPVDMTTSSYFGYDGGYHVIDTILPGKGYWVKTSSAGSLMLNFAGSPMANRAARAISRIVPTSELPPAPPETKSESQRIPATYMLAAAYPDPFNPTTTIQYSLPANSRVSLKIYNLLGQIVATLSDGIEQAGYKQVVWNASSFASGVYYYSLDAVSVTDPGKSFRSVRKLLLLK